MFGWLASSDLDIVIIGSYRPESLDRRRVTERLSALERQSRVEHVVLARLSIEEVGQLLAAVRGESAPFEVAAAVHRRTGGNPFFIEELLLAAGDAPISALADLPLPVTLTEAVLRRLDGLTAAQRRTIDAASVLGQHIPFDLLRSLTGITEDEMVDVLRTLVADGLLVEDSPDLFSVRHALTREAVAGRLLGRERRRLHERAFTALKASGSEDWGGLAHHAAGAGRLDDMVDAARHGAHHYLHTGATHQALWLADLGVAEADADLELLEMATRAAWAVGLLATALERAEKWRRLAEAADSPVDLCRALRVLARLRWEAEDREAHAITVAEARAASARLPVGEERAWVINLVAEAAFLAGRPDEAIGLTDEALAMAGPHPSTELRAAVLVNRGSAMLNAGGEQEQGAVLLQDAIDDATAVADHLSGLRGLNNLLSFALSSWDLQRCLDLLDRMDQMVAKSGRRDWAGSARTWRASVMAWVAGDSAAALAALASGPTDSRQLKWMGTRNWQSLFWAELAIENRDIATAERLLDSTRDWSEGAVNHAALSLLLAAVTDRRADLADRATEVAGHLAAASFTQFHDGANTSANALSEALRHGLAPELAADALDVLVAYPDSGSFKCVDPGWILHLRAALAEARGDTDGAICAYRGALGIEGRTRPPHALASAHLGAARLLLAADPSATEEARIDAERAVTLLERWPGWRR